MFAIIKVFLAFLLGFILVSTSLASGTCQRNTCDAGTLKLVQIVYRHGDRTPISFPLPNDRYASDSYWPEGFGQLTNRGKYRIYSLGKYLRQRYSNFLTDTPREVSARSAGSDRCLESSALLLAGKNFSDFE